MGERYHPAPPAGSTLPLQYRDARVSREESPAKRTLGNRGGAGTGGGTADAGRETGPVQMGTTEAAVGADRVHEFPGWDRRQKNIPVAADAASATIIWLVVQRLGQSDGEQGRQPGLGVGALPVDGRVGFSAHGGARRIPRRKKME